MEHIDSDLEPEAGPVSLSFEQFVHTANILYEAENDEELGHLILSGRYGDDKTVHIHNNDNFISAERLPRLATTRDLDSFLAVSRTLPYSCCLPILLVPNPLDKLSSDVHITVPVTRRRVSVDSSPSCSRS